MGMRILLLLSGALLAVSANVLAGESKGRYFEHVTSQTETVLADGRTAVIFTAKQYAISDKADDPFNDSSSDCVGRLILSEDGQVLSGSGMCFVKDVSGDGVNHAWKIEEVATSTCPDICGSWRMVDAFGKFEGTKGSGTFMRTHVFDDGVMGSFTSTYTR